MNTHPTPGAFLDEEKSVIEAIEQDGYHPVSLLTPQKLEEYQRAARARIIIGRKKITLRISRADLAHLKSRALKEGMPYQTLICSILHKAVSG